MAATMVGWQRKCAAMWTFVVGMWVLRMALCLWPQYGYIHPDEFFQGLEPMAGAVFGYNVSLPWEFRDGVRPIRNVLFPSVSIGFPDAVMKLLFGAGGVSALSLVRVPRVFVCVLSYLVDAAMYFAAVEVGRDPLFPLLVLTTSHVMNVYAFRTLSNTMELILFSLLLYRFWNVVNQDVRARSAEIASLSLDNGKKAERTVRLFPAISNFLFILRCEECAGRSRPTEYSYCRSCGLVKQVEKV